MLHEYSLESFKIEFRSEISKQFHTQTLDFQAATSHPHELRDFRIFMAPFLYIGLQNFDAHFGLQISSSQDRKL